MTKQDEIKLLDKLFKSDTYFADQIGTLDFEQMIRNIEQDFPLFLGTKHSPEIIEENRELKDRIKKLETNLDFAFGKIVEHCPDENWIYDSFDHIVILRAKMDYDLPLNEKDRITCKKLLPKT